jgi:hypothetical protein
MHLVFVFVCIASISHKQKRDMNIFRLHQLRQPEGAANLLRPENIHIPFLFAGCLQHGGNINVVQMKHHSDDG